MSTASPPIQDAATVLVYRERSEVELFMVKRHSKSAFMANAMVFPGGRLEEQDIDPTWAERCSMTPAAASQRLDHPDSNKALGLYIAAIRETFEESGILLASLDGQLISPETDRGEDLMVAGRARLNAEEVGFLHLAREFDLTLELGAMSYFSRWVTPAIEKRRYDARFFVAHAPEAQVPLHDQKETTASEWLSPRDALERYASGTIQLAPPTLRILMEIERDPTIVTRPSGTVKRAIAPQPMRKDDELHLILPGDPDYDPPGDDPNRIIRRDGRWVSIGVGA